MPAILQVGDHAWVVLVALAIDGLAGGDNRVTARITHPVVAIGKLIGWLESALNRDRPGLASRRVSGIVAVILLVAVATLAGGLAAAGLAKLPLSFWIEALVVAVFLAGRGLYQHVEAVARGLERGVDQARAAVRHIVGRDPQSLDAAGVARAAIESAAENFSDAIIAPIFWYLILGLPGLLIYKFVNTADSMIGYRSSRFREFGAASARLDDALNFFPARLSGGLIAIGAWCAGKDGMAAVAAMRDDAANHRSPNAGWPEASMAGALGLALAGPRIYGAKPVEDAWMNRTGRRAASDADIRAALRIYIYALLVAGALVLALALSAGFPALSG
ncbi:MAG: adenosylcobinamide-phosphate synthase CbiB [Hyphomicrobiales bacterium]